MPIEASGPLHQRVKDVDSGHRSGERRRLTMGTTPKKVATRAGGRPPEEAGSDDPEEQAEAILEDSENRLEKGAEESARNDKV
jgi:hypothetical protein